MFYLTELLWSLVRKEDTDTDLEKIFRLPGEGPYRPRKPLFSSDGEYGSVYPEKTKKKGLAGLWEEITGSAIPWADPEVIRKSRPSEMFAPPPSLGMKKEEPPEAPVSSSGKESSSAGNFQFEGKIRSGETIRSGEKSQAGKRREESSSFSGLSAAIDSLTAYAKGQLRYLKKNCDLLKTQSEDRHFN